MPHTRQATLIFLLLLFLQAFQLCTSKGTTPSTLIPLQVTDKMFPLDKPITGKGDGISKPDAIPEFDAEFHLDTNSGNDAGYDSGYESGLDTHSSNRIAKKRHMGAKSGYDAQDIETMFKNWIERMREAADEERGIEWKLSGDELKRSVKPNSGNGTLYAGEDYAVIALNIYRAAYMIFKLHKIDGEILVEKAHDFMVYYQQYGQEIKEYYRKYAQKLEEKYWIEIIKNINAETISLLKKMLFFDKKLDWINANLRLAENYVGLDDTHYNITTTFTIGDKNFALEDKKWLTLTENQKQGYINRKSEKKPEKWYKRLEPFEQKLIDHYWTKLVDDNHYIPTQLRSILGCRNAYQKRVLAYDAHNNPIVLGRYYHSGSLPSPIEWTDKETDFQVTKENWEQVEQHIKNLMVVSLNYNMDLPYFKQCQEKKIVEDTKRIVGPDRFINISINPIGTSYNIDKKCLELVKDSENHYKKQYPKLCNLLNLNKKQKKLNVNKINKKIEKIKDPKDKMYFKELVALMEAVNGSQFWNNFKQSTCIGDNPNANIGASYIACKAILGEAEPATSKVLFSCKSGKDRTGMMSIWVDENIIKIWYPELAESNIVYDRVVSTGHVQLLPSLNGGMPGRFAMKSVKGNQQTANFRHLLFPETAKHTHIGLVKNPKEISEIMQDH